MAAFSVEFNVCDGPGEPCVQCCCGRIVVGLAAAALSLFSFTPPITHTAKGEVEDAVCIVACGRALCEP